MQLKGILSRRDFLKLTGAALLGLSISDFLPEAARAASAPSLGRVVYDRLVIRDAPSFQGTRVGSFRRDNLLQITDQMIGGVANDYNRLWYQIGRQGYVYSGGVQPVDDLPNKAVADIPVQGVVGEVTVPIAYSSWGINRRPVPGPILYYATAHWIDEVVTDERDGSQWYKAYDQLLEAHYYLRTHDVRILSAEELLPLAPDVPEDEKRLEVYLELQMIMAFEGDQLVYTARAATGRPGFETPTGWFQTFHKRPTAHMVGGADEFSMFDLPAIPWDSYLTESGVAIHGTYWHNDFGHPHSHGCINLAPEDAKWIYRWTLPAVPEGERFLYRPGTGTPVWIYPGLPPKGRARIA